MEYFTAEKTMVKVVINGNKLPKDDVGVCVCGGGGTPANLPLKLSI